MAPLPQDPHPGALWEPRINRCSFLNPLLSVLNSGRREPRRLALLGLLAGTALMAFFAVLEDVVTRDPLVRVDDAIFHALQSLRTAPLDRVMVAITELGDWVVITAVTLVALFWLIWRWNQRTAFYLLLAVLIPSVFSFLMKLTLRVHRPIDFDSGWNAHSFPSGHVAVSTALYGFLAVIITNEQRPLRRLAATTLAATVVFSIACSRLYLGAHFLSDVLAGFSFSTAWVALLSAAYLHRNSRVVGTTGLLRATVLTIVIVGGAYVHHQYPSDMQRYALHNQ